MTRLFRYCSWPEIPAAQRAGWLVVGPLAGHHQAYSVIVEWLCGCAPRDWRGE